MENALPQAHSRGLALEILEDRQVMTGGVTAAVVPTAVLLQPTWRHLLDSRAASATPGLPGA